MHCDRKAGRGKGDNECYSEREKTDLGNVTWVRPEKGHLASEVKVANEIACDHVWDKLYPPFLLPALNGI
jgi:hypothetical protein